MTSDTATLPVDFQDICGHEHVKWALEISAAGGHHIVLSGPPGAGKTMLAQALVAILPPLSADEVREVTDLYDTCGYLVQTSTPRRPVAMPHYSTTLRGLMGSGSQQIGMVGLAHRGVLVLNDLPAFGSKLAVITDMLEQRQVIRHHANGMQTTPADLLLVGRQLSCPCGWQGSTERACTYSPALIARFQQRIPAALLDRIALHCAVPALALA